MPRERKLPVTRRSTTPNENASQTPPDSVWVWGLENECFSGPFHPLCQDFDVNDEQWGHAPIKVQHFSRREIGVNLKDFGNPCCTNEKLNGFELGGCHPFQIR